MSKEELNDTELSKEELNETELDDVAGGTIKAPVLKTGLTSNSDGSSTLRTGSEVDLAGVGDRFDGTQYVKGVTHKTDEDGYDTKFDSNS